MFGSFLCCKTVFFLFFMQKIINDYLLILKSNRLREKAAKTRAQIYRLTSCFFFFQWILHNKNPNYPMIIIGSLKIYEK